MNSLGSARPSGGLPTAPSMAPAARPGTDKRADQVAVGATPGQQVPVRPASQPGAAGKTLAQRTVQAPGLPSATAPAAAASQAARRGLMTSEGLREKAGMPKAARQFLGWTGAPRSKAYREILGALDAYHAASNDEGLKTRFSAKGADKQALRAAINSARTRAVRLRDLASSYDSGWQHTRKDAIRTLKAAMDAEIAALEQADHALKFGDLLPDCDAATVLQLLKKGISIESMHAVGIVSGREGLGLSEDELGQVDTRMKLAELYQKRGLLPQMRLLESSGLGLQGGELYRAFSVPITEETVKARVTPETFKAMGNRLGSGTFNTTTEMHFGVEGEPVRSAVFKPVPTAENGWGIHTGIDRENPRTATRNLATQALGQALGFEVIAPTELGVVPGDSGMKLGLVMDRAGGKTGKRTDPPLFLRGDVRAELVKLQILDLLCGQVDRHGGNYFIEVPEGGQARIRGIDNDQSFGGRLDGLPGHPRFEMPDQEFSRWCYAPEGPPLVDDAMAAAVNQLSEGQLGSILERLKLSGDEVSAAKDRLKELKAHIATLMSEGRVIAPDQWGQPRASRLLAERADDSYVVRDGHPEIKEIGRVGKQSKKMAELAASWVTIAGEASKAAGDLDPYRARVATKAEATARVAQTALLSHAEAATRYAQAMMDVAIERAQSRATGASPFGRTAATLELAAAKSAFDSATEAATVASFAANDAMRALDD